jgi:hypothetical protein
MPPKRPQSAPNLPPVNEPRTLIIRRCYWTRAHELLREAKAGGWETVLPAWDDPTNDVTLTLDRELRDLLVRALPPGACHER